MEKFYKLK